MAEPIRMPFGGLTHVGPRNCLLYGVSNLPPMGMGSFEGRHVPTHDNFPTHECVMHCLPVTAGEWMN